MSKYLVKILSICAFVILIPLIVLGSALCVTEAMGCTLTVLAGGIESEFGGTSSNVAIFIDGVEQKEDKVTLKKHTEVTITYQGEGYDFQGWFKGNYEEIKDNAKAVSTKESYTFLVRGNTVLTAVRDVKTYTVTYDGLMDDGETAVSIDPKTQNVVYNQPLADLAALDQSVIWGGWYIADSKDAYGTKVANFPESGTYTLNPVWSNQMFVSYYKNDTLIAKQIVAKDDVTNYELLTADNEDVKASLTKGYSFVGWTDGTNAVTSLTEFKPEGYSLYLKEEVINYEVTVKYNALSEETKVISYNAQDGFGNYNVKRDGYTFKGFVYNENLYAYDSTQDDYVYGTDKLSDVVIGNNGLSVVAEWECNYDFFVLTLAGVSYYQADGYDYESQWGLVGDVNGTQTRLQKVDISVNFADVEGEDYFDLTDDIFAYLTNGFTNLRTVDGDSVTFSGDLEISIDGSTPYDYTIDSTFSFKDLVTYIESKGLIEDLAEVSVAFVYDIA